MRIKLRKLLPIILFSLVIIILIVVTFWYMYSERYFYFWDSAMYQQFTISQINKSFESGLEPVIIAFDSLNLDYNYLYTLPLIPLMRAIGQYRSRSTFILSLALIYLLPYLFTIGIIARQILPRKRQLVFWLAVFMALFMPATWLPTWRGFPDTGGACLIALAIWIYLFDPDLKHWWQIPALGASLAVAPLFRRHFAYGVTAFLITIVIDLAIRYLTEVWNRNPNAFNATLQRILRFSLAGCISLGILLTIGLPFVKHVINQNQNLLYSAWQTAPIKVFQSFREYYGWGGLCLACIGLIAGMLSFPDVRQHIIFITTFGVFSIMQWLFIVRQPNPQYSLHFTTFIILGQVILAWIILNKFSGKLRVLATAAMGIYLGINVVISMVPKSFPNNSALISFFSNQTAPLQRSDYTDLIRLVDYLHTKANNQEPVAVVASSGVLNYDLLVQLDNSLPSPQKLNLIFTPEIDARDWYPIGSLLQADYIIAGEPLQIHLAPSEHEVLRAAYEALVNNWEISHDFTVLPKTFTLMDGVQIKIYQRVQESNLDVAIRTFAQIQANIPQKPPNQLNWIQLTNFPFGIVLADHENYQITASSAGPLRTATNFLYIGNVPIDGKISGNITFNSATCENIQLELSAAYHNGSYLPINLYNINPVAPSSFSLSFHSLNADYLLLTVKGITPSQDLCSVILSATEVSGGK